jgi:Tol biopolymer transport system component
MSMAQHGRQPSWSRATKIGATVLAAAIGVATVALILGARPAEKATTSTDSGLSVKESGVPDVDYMIDLSTGVMTPLPEAIIRSVARPGANRLPRYAASPDGSLLAFLGTGDEGSSQIFIAGIDGSGIRQLTQGVVRAWSPAWSPDGTKIAFEGSRGEGFRNLFVLDVATGWSTPIAAAGRVLPWAEPQFTTDGWSLLYSDGSSSHAVLRTVPIDGGKSTVLIGPAQGMGYAGNGSLSPDGSLVTMMGNEIGGPGAGRFVANADGTELRSIPVGGSNPAGTWSPDGSKIVCSDYSGKNILVVDIATGETSRVAKGGAAIWLDGHTLLVEA